MLFIVILLCICCLVPLADSLSMSPEFAALRGVNVVSALDGNAREMSQLVRKSPSDVSILICFRSFG